MSDRDERVQRRAEEIASAFIGPLYKGWRQWAIKTCSLVDGVTVEALEKAKVSDAVLQQCLDVIVFGRSVPVEQRD